MPLERPVSQLAREYEAHSRLFDAQPPLTRHFLDRQAAALAAALSQDSGPIRYQLPNRITLEGGELVDLEVARRKRTVGRFSTRCERRDHLVHSLNSLEQSLNPALAACGCLLRYALGRHMLYQLLPDGRDVRYLPESSDDIPSIPVGETRPGALLAASDAAAEAETARPDGDQCQVPYVDAARRFYLPQWVALGEEDRLLVNSFEEAEACVASLQKAVYILQDAAAVCPSLVSDETYQRKRAGLLGQLVNQGRALARAYSREIVARIRSRAASGTLNRGLRLSLPFFDDEELSLRTYPVEVIPYGRILFVPAFVARAMRLSEKQVRHDFRFNPSTRKHLLAQLASIEHAFNGHS
ncbi:MAG: hypothetical protein JXB85_14970 [Anaerolineales bacterium]|nr:hypothetical protein [Anaerolineales bacterium]